NPAHVAKHESLLRDMNLHSRAIYDNMCDFLGIGIEWHKKGLLMLCAKEETLEHEAKLAERANEIGIKAKVLNQEELKAADPSVTMHAAGAVHFLDDGHLTPQNFIVQLKESLKSRGVNFISNQVVDIQSTQESVVLQTQTDAHTFAQIVIAAGVFSSDLCKKLKLNLPMMAGKGYSFNLESPTETPDLCSILVEARVAVTPMESGLRFAGTMELGPPDQQKSGLRFAGTMELGPPDQQKNEKRIKGIKKSIPNYFPKFQPTDFDNKEVWLGHRPCSPDGIPYIGRTNDFPRITIATGHSMMGLSLGPVTGEYVAQIVSDSITSPYLKLLNPNRYD
ncbi:MAG: FAD-binding oxidoreductase, partial [Fimbriimonadaceae bacterium]|nr:FAD-binding oxidoreductase [Fimbriimonadaceae bacterium]